MDSTASVFGLVYIGLTLLAIPTLREQSNGPTLVVFLLACRVGGRHRRALRRPHVGHIANWPPRISPNKTWAGADRFRGRQPAVTGALFWLAIELAQWNFVRLSFAEEEWWYWLVMAVMVNVAAQVGDLAESALKRSAGVKDSGSLLPGPRRRARSH